MIIHGQKMTSMHGKWKSIGWDKKVAKKLEERVATIADSQGTSRENAPKEKAKEKAKQWAKAVEIMVDMAVDKVDTKEAVKEITLMEIATTAEDTDTEQLITEREG